MVPDAYCLRIPGKRGSGSFNLPSPNGFLFPTRANGGKRDGSGQFNWPKPNGFFFPSAQHRSTSNSKRSGSASGGNMWNLAKPNGFFFPSVTIPAAAAQKTSAPSHKRTSAEDNDYEQLIISWLQVCN